MIKEIIQAIAPLLSNEAARLFKKILNKATSISLIDGGYKCTFDPIKFDLDEDDVFSFCCPDIDLSVNEKLISEYLISNLERITSNNVEWVFGAPGENGQLVLSNGFDGSLHCLGSDGWNERSTGLTYSAHICSPIDIGLNAFVYIHPENGKLYLHDEVIEEIDIRDPVLLYLKYLDQRLTA